MSEPLRLRYVNQIVGAFLLGVVILLLAVAVLLIRSQGLLAGYEYRYLQLTQSQLDGLREGTEVYMLGRRVGEIDGLDYAAEFGDEGEPLIELRLRLLAPQLRMLAPGELDRASVTVQRKFGVGEPYLEILRPRRIDPDAAPGVGPAETDVAGDKRFIPSFRAEEDPTDQVLTQLQSISESFSDARDAFVQATADFEQTTATTNAAITNDVSPAMRSLQGASESLTATSDNLNVEGEQTLVRLRRSAENFDARMDETAGSVRTFVDGSAERAADSVTRAAESTQESVEAIRPEAVDAMRRLSAAARSLQTLSEESREVVDVLRSEANQLPGTVGRVQGAVDGANEVIDGAGQHWLLRRYINRYGPTETVSPSAIRGPSFP